MRVGLGFDIHRLVKGRTFLLGGVLIPGDVGPLGHSDGDPLLHAVTDALLGAAALGDIGEHYPDTLAETRGGSSVRILEEVRAMVVDKGYRIENVDMNVVLERPKLQGHKQKIEAKIAAILQIPGTRVNFKAKTMEGLGPVGRGEGVQAHVVVLLETEEGHRP